MSESVPPEVALLKRVYNTWGQEEEIPEDDLPRTRRGTIGRSTNTSALTTTCSVRRRKNPRPIATREEDRSGSSTVNLDSDLTEQHAERQEDHGGLTRVNSDSDLVEQHTGQQEDHDSLTSANSDADLAVQHTERQ